MRRRKEKPEIPKTMAVAEEKKEDDEDEERGNEGNRFFSCYLLASACPRYKGHTYIGFTVNPKRRIRQHNGEIRCGAWRTKRKRPWEMVFCIYGFPTNVSALQFEWAWQHPNESLAVRSAAATFKSLSGIANKIKLAYTMLTLPAWCSLNITVNYFSTKYMNNAAGCPSLPGHMRVQVSPIDELPCYSEGDRCVLENENDWEYNREYKEVCDSQVHDLMTEVPNEIPQTLMDYQTGTDGRPHELRGSDEELEDNEQVPHSSCTPSYIDVSVSYDLRGCDEQEPALCAQPCIVEGRTEIIIDDGEENHLEGSGTKLQQQPGRKNLSGIATEISEVSYGLPPVENEVIDVSTPSPDCRTSSYKFKRRVITDSIFNPFRGNVGSNLVDQIERGTITCC
ncbi:structure-specific endonuclease subunit SLX1 homolog isoform X1 [Cucurbita moschata]|uniref:Structure-specific endonuclease subunit SLX1 homolog n=1 Tax=Cucurbita moschata TaxID=3662 RepID=A0A6J1HKB9_CUCMO|nr:structure-specific endonuclease subunit SLX1 homolog isoform X1 [Cucurbita moschata]XP_022964937.1 structure-specific endonuclease subunit SLX1 homolog isoform X1 [Cucurbita moschata]